MELNVKDLGPSNSNLHFSSLINSLNIPEDHDLTKRKISSQIDLDLGFNIKKIEEILRTQALMIDPETKFNEWGPLLHHGAQTWVGLDFQILQCTYHDLKTIFHAIKPSPFQKVIDLGAGYGRMGLFLHWFYPLTQFLGVELVPERVNEGNRIYELNNLINKKLEIGDLSQLTELPEGDIYFIYDFGSEEHLLKILNLLKNEKGKILVVKGRICYNLMIKDPYWSNPFPIKKLDDVFLFYL